MAQSSPTNPSVYTNRISTLQSSLNSMLLEFKQKYTNYYNNPKNQTHSAAYTNLVSNINTKLRGLNQLSTAINTQTNTVNNTIQAVNTNINTAKLINQQLKYAGDFDLWSKFSKNSRLISVNIPIGIFRKRKNQRKR